MDARHLTHAGVVLYSWAVVAKSQLVFPPPAKLFPVEINHLIPCLMLLSALPIFAKSSGT